MPLTRRRFVQGTLAASATLSLGLPARVRGANDDIRLAVIGLRGRGNTLFNWFVDREGVRIVAVCDVDESVLSERLDSFNERVDYNIEGVTDYRKLLERDDIDAVVIGSPNHWHSLMTIQACQAGKDVYVEKPLSHRLWEGRQLLNAARRYDRIVCHGTQSRSNVGTQDMVKYVQDGKLGKLKYVIGTCYKRRDSIGRRSEPLNIPDHVNYDLWCGPALKQDLYRNSLHYDWHWDYNTGDGDLGNQGVHQMDLARWFLGEEGFPRRVLSIGGRLGYEDAGNSANTQVAWFDYETAPLLFEVRGLPEHLDDIQGGARIGVLAVCEDGYVSMGSYSSGRAYDNDGEVIESFSGGGNHAQNFIDAIRSRKREDLNAEAAHGHLSSGLCHLANISHVVGQETPNEQIAEQISSKPVLQKSYDRMLEHARANDVDFDKYPLTLGAALEFDPETEQFTNNDKANEKLKGLIAPPREEYAIPTIDPA